MIKKRLDVKDLVEILDYELNYVSIKKMINDMYSFLN
jgi:hypothetical protein